MSPNDHTEIEGEYAPAAERVLRHFTLNGTRTLAFSGGEFLAFDGGVYRRIDASALRRVIYAAIGGTATTHKEREVKAILEAHCHVERHAPCWIDQRPGGPDAANIIVLKSTLFDLSTGRSFPHTPRFFAVNKLPFDFDAKTPTPLRFLTMLQRQWSDEPEITDVLQEAFGYCLAPDWRLHHFFVLYGAPRSGKSTVARVLECLLGADNVANPTVGQYAKDFGLKSLVGKLASVTHDANFAQSVPPAFVESLKTITGGGAMDVRGLYENYNSSVITARPWFVTNNPPNIHDDSGAIRERMLAFPFTYPVPEDERDADLLARIIAEELPGIFLWALQGRRRLLKRGRFTPTPTMRAFAEDFTADPVSEFVDDECDLSDRAGRTPVKALYAAYERYCQRHRVDAVIDKLFGQKLRDIAPQVRRERAGGGEREWYYLGIALRTPLRTDGASKTIAASAESDEFTF